jgi:hypothetical protein
MIHDNGPQVFSMFTGIFALDPEPKGSNCIRPYMDDCRFCKTVPLKQNTIVAWCIGFPASPKPIYLRYNTVVFPELDVDTFRFSVRFTPHARLTLNLARASQLLAHEQAWTMFVKEPSVPYGAFCEQDPKDLSTYNLDLPRDWDVIILTATDYILTKRAARILLHSATQFHVPLMDYLQAFNLLKVVNAYKPAEPHSPAL